MRDPQHVERVMRTLGRAISGMDLPAVEKISESQSEDPFQILIATLLSARTQDATTHAASTRLFKRARTPRTMARLDVKEIETLIYPVSFYRNKARHVKACCEMLVDRYRGRVPSTMADLVTLPGVGRKTANLVLILGFKSGQNICVDTHVHRISNRLGWVKTRSRRKRSRRSIDRRSRAGGRCSICISSPGDRTCAGRSIRDVGIAPSRPIVEKLAYGGGLDESRSVCTGDGDSRGNPGRSSRPGEYR